MTVRAQYAGAPATTHTVTMPGCIAGRGLVVLATAGATLTATSASQTAGWVRDVHELSSVVLAVFRLPAGSNPGGSVVLGVDLNGPRAMAAVAVEDVFVGGPTYSGFAVDPPSAGVWGTGLHTFAEAGRAYAVYAACDPDDTWITADATAFDQAFTEVGDSGYADAGNTTENCRVWVAERHDVAMSSNGVTATMSGTLTGMTGYRGMFVIDASSILPIADAGDDQARATGGLVTLAGSASYVAGTIEEYAWSQVSGPAVSLSGAATATATFTPAATGEHVFELVATADDLLSGTDQVSVWVGETRVHGENLRPGRDRTEWHDGVPMDDMPAFARSTFYAPGSTAQFSVDYNSAFTAEIHRLGWYGGEGARLVDTVTGTPTSQPAGTTIPDSNGALDCANWSANLSWSIPAEMVPGVYFALLRGQSATFGHVLFVVTDTDAPRPVLVTLSDATWIGAYNYYGGPGAVLTGKSIYGAGGPLGTITNRALCGSYDRPVVTREGVPQTYYFNAEYPFLRFMEQFGYDVGYATKEQIDADPDILLDRDVVLSVGHDEYISERVWDAFKAAVTAGISIASFAANDFFWRTRYGITNGADTTTRGRVMWCRKDTMSGPGGHVAGDPIVVGDWGGTWRDTRWAGARHEKLLWADHFIANGSRLDDLLVPFSFKAVPVWRNCPVVQALTSGQDANLGDETLGFEWDEPRAASGINAVDCSSTTITLTGMASDENGQIYSLTATPTHQVQFGQHAGGGFFFNASTCQWSWGLDDFHDRGNPVANADVRQATLNVLLDLGAAAVEDLVTGDGLTFPAALSPSVNAAYGLPPSITRAAGSGIGLAGAATRVVSLLRTVGSAIGFSDTAAGTFTLVPQRYRTKERPRQGPHAGEVER